MTTAPPPFRFDHTEPELNTDVLRRAFSCFPSGVVGLCATVDGQSGPEITGMAASSFVAVSFEPPLVAFCVQLTSTTWPKLASVPHLGLSVLGEGHSLVARQLASRTRDRFAGLSLEKSSDGAVFIDGATAWLDCSVESTVPAGDHAIVLLRVNALKVAPGAEPLVYHGSTFRRLLQVVAA